jgi:hypothetical protein
MNQTKQPIAQSQISSLTLKLYYSWKSRMLSHVCYPARLTSKVKKYRQTATGAARELQFSCCNSIAATELLQHSSSSADAAQSCCSSLYKNCCSSSITEQLLVLELGQGHFS